jgi:hypothetical protein
MIPPLYRNITFIIDTFNKINNKYALKTDLQ